MDKEDKAGEVLSVRRQCELLGGGNRKRLAARPAAGLGTEKPALACQIDKLHLRLRYSGRTGISQRRLREGWEEATRRLVGRIMGLMGLAAILRCPRISVAAAGEAIYSYLLRGQKIWASGEGRCADVAYISMACGFAFLVVVMDWAKRAVLSWRLSNTLDGAFWLEA